MKKVHMKELFAKDKNRFEQFHLVAGDIVFDYSKNIITFLTHLATKDGFKWEMEEEITKGSLIVHNGQAVHPSVAKPVNT